MILIDWVQFYYLVFYFIIYSIGGWVVESVYRSISEKKIVNSGFMYGPYCPIYGFGTMIMILILQNLKNDITLLFVVSFVILTAWEYLVGVYLEKVYHTKYWDYSDQKINFKGRICLVNSIYWGVLGIAFTLFIHPFIAKNVIPIPVNTVFYIDLIVGIIMLTDFTISSINTRAIYKKIQELKILSESIKEKLKKLGENKKQQALNKKQKLQQAEIDKLQIQHNRLKITLYRQLTRMKKAFPNIQSEALNKFLSEKIDITDLKEKIKAIRDRTKEISEDNGKKVKSKKKEQIKKIKKK